MRRLLLLLRVVGLSGIAATTLLAQTRTPAPSRAPAPPARQTPQRAPAFVPLKDSLRLYYVGRPVGWERFEWTARDGGTQMDADFDYIDRGRRNHLNGRLVVDAGNELAAFEIARVTDSSRVVSTRVSVQGRTASIVKNGVRETTELPSTAFVVASYQPIAQHLPLMRYWKSHGRPASLAVVPGAPVNQLHIVQTGADTIGTGTSRQVLSRFSITGAVWGVEYLWLDAQDRLAMFASAAGGLSFKAVRGELVPMADELMAIAARTAMKDLAVISARTAPVASGRVALIDATVIDGTGAAATPHTTVLVRDGRIESVGASATMRIPAGTRRVSMTGKTIVPGLWDSHAHLHQLEWIPVYLAAGITTVRDMGNELPFIRALRKNALASPSRGPNIVVAGLIDGPGPNAFGAMSANTPEEGRAIVRTYHDEGFQQIKLYSLLSPAVVAAICQEAHALGMIVTGHIPTSLTLLAAIDSGMDQVAHQPIRGEPGSDELTRTITSLKAHGTVIDPTSSWGEIGGHSQAEPLQHFQPGAQFLPPIFMQTRAAGWGTPSTDTTAAHARVARSLAVTKALHDAGIPIVAGTDEGVPGFSVYREMELYVQGGFTPMEALRSATAVPAKAMRMDGELGTIEAGKRADLLVLDANPLDNISNIRSLRYVMKSGTLFESAALFRAIGFGTPVH